ncbi:MAG: radical SAM protein [Lachnotalea sp.]
MHYTGTIWRPPYEAYSALIQVTVGCTHHGCKFCTLYEELPFDFRLSPVTEVEQDLKELAKYYKNTKRVFFTGGNPFALSFEKLESLAKMTREYFPSMQSMGCFARITDITPKSKEQLKRLRELGFNEITIGVETGDDAALQFMNKGFGVSEIIEQCKRLEEAGIDYHFFYLTGISGHGKGNFGAKETAKVFNMLHPKRIVVSMMTITKTSKLFQEIQKGNWKEESEIEKLEELKTLIKNLKIHTYFATEGSSNLVCVVGNLPGNKKKLTTFLDKIIKDGNEAELRKYRENLRSL